MDIGMVQTMISAEQLMKFMEEFKAFGPLLGILLPMLEAILPFLPLVLFVAWNANVYGLWFGFLFSWTGAVAGALIVFFVVRKLANVRFFRWLCRHPKVKRFLEWVEWHGFGPLFILICFPFTPGAIINVVAALSRVSVYQFLLAIIFGKMIMIFMVSFIGHDLVSLSKHPTQMVLMSLIIFALWYVGKRIEKRYNEKVRP